MPPMTTARRWCALLALTLGGFGIGSTEFVAMGLLPDLARDLLPRLSAAAPDDAIAHAGRVVTAYALGVVVGAPTFALLSLRLPRKALLLVLAGVLALGTFASAVLPTFGLVMLARFVAALPHGAYFGAATLTAGRIMGPGNQGRGIAFVLSGFTLANVVGVPLITRFGQVFGWRSAYVAVALVFVVTLLAVLVAVPEQPRPEGTSVRTELRVLRLPQLWLVVGLVAVGFGGFFAVYTYVAEVVRVEAGLAPSTVPWVLAVLGVGMVVGNLLGGRLADLDLRRTILLGFPVLALAMAFLGTFGGSAAGVFVGCFAVGAATMLLVPGVQSRLIAVAAESPLLGAALVHSALNVANSVGAVLGGVVIAAGWGFLAPSWLGVGLALAGAGMAAAGFAHEDRSHRAALATQPVAPPARSG